MSKPQARISSGGAFFGGSYFGSAFFGGAFQAGAFQADAFQGSSLVLQAVVVPGAETDDGVIVEAAAIPWFKIVELLKRDPEAAHQIHWRKWRTRRDRDDAGNRQYPLLRPGEGV